MHRRGRAILFVISSMLMVLLASGLVTVFVVDIEGVVRTRASKTIFLGGATVAPFFVLLGRSLKCNRCKSRLITFGQLGVESTSWNTALRSLVSNAPIVCRACGSENRLRERGIY